MSTVILFGFLSGFAILIGAFLGLYLKLSHRMIATCMAFGSGVLISALSIDLMQDAFEKTHSATHLVVGFLAGALIFVLGDYFIDNAGGYFRRHSYIGSKPKSETPDSDDEGNSGTAIFLGTLLDGIPESFVLGVALSEGLTGGVVFVAALFLSNLPEGMSGTIGMKASGMSHKNILLLWTGTLIVTLVATLAGYLFLSHTSDAFKAICMSFASGAILAMLCDTMIPEAFKYGGRFVALVTVIGFLLAFLLSKMF